MKYYQMIRKDKCMIKLVLLNRVHFSKVDLVNKIFLIIFMGLLVGQNRVVKDFKIFLNSCLGDLRILGVERDVEDNKWKKRVKRWSLELIWSLTKL